MSNSSLLHPYLPLTEKQIVPEYTKFNNPSRQSVILDRMSTAYPPSSGTSYTIGSTSGQSNQISFLISDSSRFMDLTTACLCFDFTLSSNAATAAGQYVNALPADSGVALFSRLQSKVAGVLCEDILNLNSAFNNKMISTMNKDHYDNNQDVLCGSWALNQNYGGDNSSVAGVNARFFQAQSTQYQATTSAAAAGVATVSRSFVIPLSYLSGLFSVQKLLPLPLMNTVELNLYFENIVTALYVPTGAVPSPTAAQLSYALSNVRLTVDMVEMNSSYATLIKQIAYNDESGLNIAVDTTQSFGINYSASNNSSQQLSFNKASPFVRGVQCHKTNPPTINSLQGMSTLNFINNGNKGVRISVGSIYNPVYGDTANDAITYATMRVGDNNNVIAGGLQNASLYSGRITTNAPNGTTQTLTLDGIGTCFTFGFNFDKVLNSLVDKDGLDTGALGSALVVYLNEGTVSVSGQMLLNVFITYTRHLQMKGGVISISG